MSAKSSALAALTFGGSACAGLGTVTVNVDQTMIDTTDIATGERTYIVGNRGFTATVDMFYDQADAGMAAVETAIDTGAGSSAVVLTLSTGMTYSGSAFVQSFSATASTNEVIRANFTLQFTGSVTVA
jgi:predicted secreted protein